jgi:ubiquitin-like protein Pup
MTVQAAKRLLAVEEFYRMCEAGIFKPEERLELIDGEIITMAPIGQRHHACVMLLTMTLAPRLEGRALVSVQGPLALGPDQLRYPDLVLLRRQADVYRTAGPTATDAFLVIEVADTSVDYDRDVKVPLYAQAGIPEVWLVDLTTNHLEVCASLGAWKDGPTNGAGHRDLRWIDAAQYTAGNADIEGAGLPRAGPVRGQEAVRSMAEQKRKVERPKGPSEGEGGGANPEVAKKGKKIKEDLDKLLDEIDEILEENAEEFVKSYVQRGGQ